VAQTGAFEGICKSITHAREPHNSQHTSMLLNMRQPIGLIGWTVYIVIEISSEMPESEAENFKIFRI
jgi:hypothetical protein